MIKVVSLDLSGTLIDDRNYIDEFWFDLLPREVSKVKKIPFKKAVEYCKESYDEYYKKHGMDKNWISPYYWIKRFGIKKNLLEILKMLKEKPIVYEDTHEVLEKLSKKYKIIISTSHPPEFLEVSLKKIDISKIDKTFCSLKYGLSKEDKEFWETILKELKIKPNEIIHIGDLYKSDYLIPISVGMNAFLLKRENISLLNAIKLLKL